MIALIVSIVIAQAAGFIGSIFTFSSIPTWYASLVKPSFAPPNWLFGPAWILLYTLMGTAAYLVWKKRGMPGVKSALLFYGVHLALNALWSIIFFGMKSPGLAFVEIIILWVLILVVGLKFLKIERLAGLLFIPYIAWVTFAAILNFAVWRLN